MSTGSDFYYTGGGFSDWSGGSAGNFSCGSSSSSSSGGYSLLSKVKDEDRKLGYPNKAAYSLGPSFVEHLWLRWIWVFISMVFLVISILVYVNRVDEDESLLGAGGFYFFGALGMLTVMSSLEDIYPIYVYPQITEKKYRRFYDHQRVILWFCSITTMLVSLTPFICWPLEDFLNAELKENGMLSFMYFLHQWRTLSDYSIGLDFGLLVGFVSVITLVFIVSSMNMCKESQYKKRLQYIMLKANAYDEKKTANLKRIQEIQDKIEEKKKEIASLMEEKRRIEKPEL